MILKQHISICGLQLKLSWEKYRIVLEMSKMNDISSYLKKLEKVEQIKSQVKKTNVVGTVMLVP